MTLDSLPDLDTSGLSLVKTLSTALTCWPYRNMALRDGARTSTWWWACEARRGRSGRGSGRCSGLSVVRDRLSGCVLKRSSISSSGDGPTSPGGVAVDRAGGGLADCVALWHSCLQGQDDSREVCS